MATIDRDKLLTDVKAWLPSSQTLTDSIILLLNETIITSIADDDTYYLQILCESIKASARKMMVDYSIDSSGLKKEKTNMVEVEYYNLSSKNPWKDYYNNVERDVCPMFGYYAPAPTYDYSPITTIEYNNTLLANSNSDCCDSDC